MITFSKVPFGKQQLGGTGSLEYQRFDPGSIVGDGRREMPAVGRTNPLGQLVHDLAQPLCAIGNLASACAAILASSVVNPPGLEPTGADSTGLGTPGAEHQELVHQWMHSIGREVRRASAIVHALQAIARNAPEGIAVHGPDERMASR